MAAAILMWYKRINVEQGFHMVHQSFYDFIQDVHVPWTRFELSRISIVLCQDCRASWDAYLEEENGKRRRRC